MSRFALITTVAATFLITAANAVETFEDIFDDSYTLGSDGSISIKNTDGSIRIYAADVDEVHVHALKRAYSAARLNDIEVVANATANALTIETRYPPKPSGFFADKSGTVDYTLIVPMRTRITSCELSAGELLIEGLEQGSAKAHLVNGWLGVHNCFVDTDVAISNGKLDLAYDWWQPEKSFRANASSVTGLVHASVAPEMSAAISAASERGKIANTLDDENTGPAGTARSVEVSVGDARGVTMTLRSTDGNIRIDRSY